MELLEGDSPRFGSLMLSDVLPVTPYGAEYGRLRNGLTYYVRANSKPKMRASLTLAVKVGSVLEEEDERGVAHMVEHLAFRATAKYPDLGIVKFLQSIGAPIGACQNAETSFDDTVYHLCIPIDEPGHLSQAISILGEFSSEVLVSANDLDKERGVIMEEYRKSRNADGRMQHAEWVLVMEGSKYAERSPIGLDYMIRTVSHEIVNRFYKKWYHMQNMAVIAVGDFPDTQMVVDLINTHFEDKIAIVDPPVKPHFPVPSHEVPHFLTVVESEVAQSTALISCMVHVEELKTVKDYRNFLSESLFFLALNARLMKLAYENNPPYFSCMAAIDVLTYQTKAYRMTSHCKQNGTTEALEAMLTEVARVRIHGFFEREISVARGIIMSSIESDCLRRDQMESTDLRQKYVQHFLKKEPVLGIEYKVQLYKVLLPDISASEVSKRAEHLRTSCSCAIRTVEPQSFATVDDLKTIVLRVNSSEEARNISPWEDEHTLEEIVSAKPTPGHVVHQVEHSSINATEVILSNGMRVCYKCTDFLDDEVLFEGFSYGGFSELLECEYISCSLGPILAGEIGEFGHRPSVHKGMLAGKTVEVNSMLAPYTRNFCGYCSPSHLETGLQLMYQLFMTEVEPDEEAVKMTKLMVKEDIRSEERDPSISFANFVKELKCGSSHFSRPLKVDDCEKFDPLKSCEYFNTCFKDPSNFTVVLVGNIDRAIAFPLMLQYLGGIPRPPKQVLNFKRDELTDLPFTFPSTVVREVVKIPMVEAQCSVQLCFPIELDKDNMIEDVHLVKLLCKLLENNITRVLRLEHGKTYFPQVCEFLGFNNPSRESDIRGDINVVFSCDPDDSYMLVDLALDEILRLQNEGPSTEEVLTILKTEQTEHEDALQENQYWLDMILSSYQSRSYSGNVGASFKDDNERRARVRDNFIPAKAQSTLQRIIPFPCTKRYILAIQKPES